MSCPDSVAWLLLWLPGQVAGPLPWLLSLMLQLWLLRLSWFHLAVLVARWMGPCKLLKPVHYCLKTPKDLYFWRGVQKLAYSLFFLPAFGLFCFNEETCTLLHAARERAIVALLSAKWSLFHRICGKKRVLISPRVGGRSSKWLAALLIALC